MFSKRTDKARVSPCCGSEGDSPPSEATAAAYTGIKRAGLYSGDCVKPAPGNLPSSKACYNFISTSVSISFYPQGWFSGLVPGGCPGRGHDWSQTLGHASHHPPGGGAPANQDPVQVWSPDIIIRAHDYDVTQVHPAVLHPLPAPLHGEGGPGQPRDRHESGRREVQV